MRMRLWAVALASGALAAILLGISMLAASQTTKRASMSPANRWPLLMSAELKAFNSVQLPLDPTATVSLPCGGKEHLGASQTGASQTAELNVSWGRDPSSIASEARCLHRHGFLSRSDLASIINTSRTRTRHSLGRVVPLSLQIEPSVLSLSGWTALLSLELLGALLFIRSLRRPRRPPPVAGRL
jgi:hypothetical protein